MPRRSGHLSILRLGQSLHQTRGNSIAQIAKDLGINAGTLSNWVALECQGRERNRRLDGDQRLELARLRRENAEQAMERDVLKRSVALWVKDATGRR